MDPILIVCVCVFVCLACLAGIIYLGEARLLREYWKPVAMAVAAGTWWLIGLPAWMVIPMVSICGLVAFFTLYPWQPKKPRRLDVALGVTFELFMQFCIWTGFVGVALIGLWKVGIFLVLLCTLNDGRGYEWLRPYGPLLYWLVLLLSINVIVAGCIGFTLSILKKYLWHS